MGIERSPKAKKRAAARRKAQERRWAARSGPVIVTKPADKAETRQDPDRP